MTTKPSKKMTKDEFNKFAFNGDTLENKLKVFLPKHNGNYVDAIVEIQDLLELDFDFVAQYMTPALKEKVRQSAIQMNLMKPSTDNTLDA